MFEQAAFTATKVPSKIKQEYRIFKFMSHIQANRQHRGHPAFSVYPTSLSSCMSIIVPCECKHWTEVCTYCFQTEIKVSAHAHELCTFQPNETNQSTAAHSNFMLYFFLSCVPQLISDVIPSELNLNTKYKTAKEILFHQSDYQLLKTATLFTSSNF